MFENFAGKYKKALVIGTGGGNDIVSAVLIAMYLQKQGMQTDIAGILSPAAMHYFQGKKEEVVNKLDSSVKRKIPSKNPAEISFIDGKLPELTRDSGIDIKNFYDFSLRYGTEALVEQVNGLIASECYDLFIAVDMGGDILARGKEDPTILSPMMDFSSLYLLGKVNIDSYLVEFGLGTDGELRPEGMREILAELRREQILLAESTIDKDDDEVKRFNTVYKKIEKIRRGHATVMTLKTLELEQDHVSHYRFKSRLGDRKWYTQFKVVLPAQYFRKAYLIDGKKIQQRRPRTALPYSTILEQYIKLKKVPLWKTELDLFYVWTGKKEDSPGTCMHLLAPSLQIPPVTRKEIIKEGIRHLEEGHCDASLILEQDSDIAEETQLNITKAGKFCLITNGSADCDAIEQTRKDIERYQN